MQFLQTAMNHYGYWILSIGLMLEVLALPLPGEFLMSYAGLLIYQGKMSWALTILAAAGGSSLGMTAAYWIGYALGVPFFEKFGPKIHLGPDKLHKMSAWFDRYGNKVLLISYFIPGVRHFTGYFTGVTRLPFRTFAVYAYTGAFLWTGLFITLGKILGPQWEKYQHTISRYMLLAGILVAMVLLVRHFVRKKKLRWKRAAVGWIDRAYRFFESIGRVGVMIAVESIVFLAAIAWAVGLVQDFLDREFSEFDQLASFIVHERGICGGIGWEIGLRRLFHREGPNFSPYSFPSEPVILTVVFVGFAAYFALDGGVPGCFTPYVLPNTRKRARAADLSLKVLFVGPCRCQI